MLSVRNGCPPKGVFEAHTQKSVAGNVATNVAANRTREVVVRGGKHINKELDRNRYIYNMFKSVYNYRRECIYIGMYTEPSL